MRRRDFIIGIAGSTTAWPLAARAQQGKVARIGFLGLDSAKAHAPRLAALRAGLQELGWIEGRNIMIEFRWADGNYSRLPMLAADLVGLNVDVIVTHAAAGALAAKSATSTIPIVVTAIADMLGLGLIESLSRPAGNITGLSIFSAELTAKRLELAKEAVPSLTKVAVLLNPDNSANRLILPEALSIAKSLNVELRAFEARQPSDFEPAFAAMANQQIGALVVHEDNMLVTNAKALAVLAAEGRLPTCGFPELVRSGGLLAYGINFPDTDYRAAAFIDKILKGAKPTDLPVEQPTRFEFIINLKTAKALGIALPTSILLRADEVIE
jgi:putative tryptophan/tyrosine transport system substrate-binding protein